jgi:uncharacterized phage protein gp47/JayE
VPSTYDKTTGSFMYDALKPASEQLAATDVKIEIVKEKFLISNLSDVELADRINAVTGLERKVATTALGIVTLTGTGTVTTGALFETPGGIQFEATETKEIIITGTVPVKAVISGSGGNVASGAITLFPITIPGFTSVNNADLTADGYNAESDSDLTARYYEKLRAPATSGNKAQYIGWAKSVIGVGDARAISLWDGNNTVKLVIIDSNKQASSIELVASVQSYVDPGITGLGDGVAPLGAFCTVVSATAVDINISVTMTLESGVEPVDATTSISDSITAYLAKAAFVDAFISHAKIGSAIINSQGVTDYSDLTVNGGSVNINVDSSEVAVLGTLVVA